MELESDCARCAGLCCIAPAFAKSSDFAIDKPAGRACPNLGGDHRCRIHDVLEPRGFKGCTVFECFGAGQHLVQGPITQADSLRLLPVMRQLHELAWLIDRALELDAAAALHAKLREAYARTERLADGTAAELAALDVDAHRQRVNRLLQRASELARAGAGGRPGHRRPDHRGANLIGRRMRGADLRGANLRGALLVGADLRDADLRRADLTGADLRGADLSGADLTGALFLTASQLRSARTTEDTRHP